MSTTLYPRMSNARLVAAYAGDIRFELIKMLRTPAFAVPTLVFPAMFYLLFGVLLTRNNPAASIDTFARMGVFGSTGNARTFDYRAGDVGYVPFAMGHYVENTGDGPLRFLEMFKSARYADVSLNQWLALTPPELVRASLDIDDKTVRALHKNKSPVVPA